MASSVLHRAQVESNHVKEFNRRADESFFSQQSMINSADPITRKALRAQRKMERKKQKSQKQEKDAQMIQAENDEAKGLLDSRDEDEGTVLINTQKENDSTSLEYSSSMDSVSDQQDSQSIINTQAEATEEPMPIEPKNEELLSQEHVEPINIENPEGKDSDQQSHEAKEVSGQEDQLTAKAEHYTVKGFFALGSQNGDGRSSQESYFTNDEEEAISPEVKHAKTEEVKDNVVTHTHVEEDCQEPAKEDCQESINEYAPKADEKIDIEDLKDQDHFAVNLKPKNSRNCTMLGSVFSMFGSLFKRE